ncbi:TIGR03089 family protein [Nostocoides australiense]|nr:TIGR03089 family protein [Tetrasphaera australiensis]HRW00937.1 TIGR03089 family protein [Tetrasphaera sp.]
MRVDQLLPAMLRSDPARPRITCYDDTTGERIELSGKVLANWVAKAQGMLNEQFDAAPGMVLRLDLPPHWRTVYWALAAWGLGMTIDLTTDHADATVTTNPLVEGVVVTLPALARSAPTPLTPGAIDEARELAAYGDQFTPWDSAEDDTAALAAAGATRQRYADPPAYPLSAGARVHTATRDVGEFLQLAIGAYAADGSLVLSIGPDPARLPGRLRTEGVSESR